MATTLAKEEMEKEVDRILEEYGIHKYNSGYRVLREVIIIMHDTPDTNLRDAVVLAADKLGYEHSTAQYVVNRSVDIVTVSMLQNNGKKLTPKKFVTLCANRLSDCVIQ